jgi:hypothetical protein
VRRRGEKKGAGEFLGRVMGQRENFSRVSARGLGFATKALLTTVAFSSPHRRYVSRREVSANLCCDGFGELHAHEKAKHLSHSCPDSFLVTPNNFRALHFCENMRAPALIIACRSKGTSAAPVGRARLTAWRRESRARVGSRPCGAP